MPMKISDVWMYGAAKDISKYFVTTIEIAVPALWNSFPLRITFFCELTGLEMKEWKVTEVEESETDWNWCSNEIEVESETRVDFMGAFSALLEPWSPVLHLPNAVIATHRCRVFQQQSRMRTALMHQSCDQHVSRPWCIWWRESFPGACSETEFASIAGLGAVSWLATRSRFASWSSMRSGKRRSAILKP